ncbi:hypothetical protein DF3PB_710004 [uncultured Defluviicoccus sp.]|uniref:Uncharacterized protein n=1 Tax=metagenome TaxID=256318 RepID=A0A380TJ51_9ZZZZ|nr:hypothetical protein DF3PB_710004 [uncultured Defluviicoccus sp.]
MATRTRSARKAAAGAARPARTARVGPPPAIELVDALFALARALFEQSENASRWSASERQLLRDERRETSALEVEIESRSKVVNERPPAELTAAIAAAKTASESVRSMRSRKALGPALADVNDAQRLARALLGD